MTVGELKQKIANLPDDMDVMIYQYNDESLYALAEKAEAETVTFSDEEMDPEEYAKVDCLVITDNL